jgi:single-strand DNA-binding protein
MNGLQCAATGRVTFDPEQRFTSTGKALVTFSMVVDQGHTVATEERAAPAPIYLKVTAWEPSDELLAQLRKGASVYVEGKLTHGTWTAADGTPRCGLNVSAWRVDVHGAIGKRASVREDRPTWSGAERTSAAPFPAVSPSTRR